jgi:hypothetical protein
MFGRKRRDDEWDREEHARRIERKPSYGELLARAGSDRARSELCREWAEQARLRWFQGQRETVLDIVRSKSIRYRHYSAQAREAIGRMQWVGCQEQVELAADEVLFTRWADHYKGQADSRGEPVGQPKLGRVRDPLGVFDREY